MRSILNTWNRIRYTVYAPGYDRVVRVGRQRERSIRLLNPRAGDRVLIAGAGTGADLPFLPRGAAITAIDITPAMVRRVRRRAEILGLRVDARVGNVERLDFPAESFDKVILHLILAIVADPVAVIAEVDRVLKPGGRAVVFDKFVADGRRPSWPRRLANPVAWLLATDINRRLGDILQHSSLRPIHRENAWFGGFFTITLVEKQPGV
jgi:ubiquinone/menaquinone biosynthesis C-methylase UbiE